MKFTCLGFTPQTLDFKQLKDYDIYYRKSYGGYEVLRCDKGNFKDVDIHLGYGYYVNAKNELYKAVRTPSLEWIIEEEQNKQLSIFDFIGG